MDYKIDGGPHAGGRCAIAVPNNCKTYESPHSNMLLHITNSKVILQLPGGSFLEELKSLANLV